MNTCTRGSTDSIFSLTQLVFCALRPQFAVRCHRWRRLRKHTSVSHTDQDSDLVWFGAYSELQRGGFRRCPYGVCNGAAGGQLLRPTTFVRLESPSCAKGSARQSKQEASPVPPGKSCGELADPMQRTCKSLDG